MSDENSKPAGPYSIGSTVWPGLSKLVEEMGEVGQVVGKLIATGGDPAHRDGTDLRGLGDFDLERAEYAVAKLAQRHAGHPCTQPIEKKDHHG
jgi:hypothetical protein